MSMEKKNRKVIIEKLFEEYKLDEARDELEKYKIESPYDFDIYSIEAIYYYLKGDFEKAEKTLKQAFLKRKYNFDIHYNLANIYEKKGDRELAFEYYSLADLLVENIQQKGNIDDAIDFILKQEEELDVVEYEQKMEKYEQILKNIKEKEKYSTKIFPEENLISRRWKDYYLGRYNGMKHEIFGKSLPKTSLLHKIEMFKIEENLCWSESGNYFVPIAVKKEETEIAIRRNQGVEKFIFDNDERFYYFKINSNDKIITDEDAIIGKPILLKKIEMLQDIVLIIFIDGLSETVLEEYGLEELMPRTKAFFKEGTWCKNVYVTGEWTYPNLASFYTGEYTTKHQMFHPHKISELPRETKLLSEIFKENGYMTAKIDADWRSVPTDGYYRGFDRILYQPAFKVMDAPSVIEEVIENIESFKETNQFIWTCIPDLHDIADGYQSTISMQVHEELQEKPNNKAHEQGESSVKQQYSDNKKGRYIKQIKRIDRYLGLLYSYLEQNFDRDKVTVALISDHGQGYLVGNDEHMLSEARVKVPFMFRGKGVPKGECEELIEGLDLMSILDKLVSPKVRDIEGDMNLPRYFGGTKEREYTYSESIFPGDTYKVSIHSKNIIVYYETVEKVKQDSSVDMENYTIKLVDRYTQQVIEDEQIRDRYLEIINDHMKYNRIYR